MMRILYVGAQQTGSTSAQRARALERLGHEVTVVDPSEVLSGVRILQPLHYRTGYTLLQSRVESWVRATIQSGRAYDVCWIDSGEMFGFEAVRLFAAASGKCVLYNHDDPTGPRDWSRFFSLRRALSNYDLCVTVRRETEVELSALGAKSVLRVWRSYDELDHAPVSEFETAVFDSDVAFIGTCIPGEGRDEFILELVRAGLNVSVWGDRWHRSKLWTKIKHVYKGPALSGRSYTAAIGASRICLGLLSSQNRDLHTTRTMEIPYAGGLLCAQRTSEHMELYTDGVEAVFWDGIDECLTMCVQLLNDPDRREQIRLAGMAKVRSLGVGHEDICRAVLAEISV